MAMLEDMFFPEERRNPKSRRLFQPPVPGLPGAAILPPGMLNAPYAVGAAPVDLSLGAPSQTETSPTMETPATWPAVAAVGNEPPPPEAIPLPRPAPRGGAYVDPSSLPPPAALEPLPAPVPAAAAPVPPDAAAAPAAPAGAPGVPSWLGMLNAPLNHPLPPAADAAALPPTSAPVSGPAAAPPGAVPQTSLLGRIHDMINDRRGTLLALGAGLAGAQNIGQGLSRGFALAGPAMQADIKQSQLNASLPIIRDKLIQGGMSPTEAAATATAAVGNPAIMGQILPQVFGPKQSQFTQIGEDWMGNKRFGFVDPVSKRVYGTDGKEISQGSSSDAGNSIPSGPDGQPLTGQALLQHIERTDPVAAAGIKGIIAGDVNAGGRNLQKLLPLAKLVDPTMEQSDYATRAKTRAEYTSGPGGKEIKASNTAIDHAHKLAGISEKLGGVDVAPGVLNPVIQGYKYNIGDKEYQEARKDWDTVAETLATEVSKALNGGTPHVADKEHWRTILNGDNGPTARAQAIKSVMSVLEGRMNSAAQNYNQGMRTSRDGIDFIDPSNVEKYKALLQTGHQMRSGAAASAPTPAAATAPAAPPGAIPPGQPLPPRVRYDPATNMFIPIPVP